MTAHLGPACCTIGSAVEPCVFRSLDNSVNIFRVGRRNSKTNSTLIFLGQSCICFIPGLSAICRFINIGAGTATDISVVVSSTLEGGSVQYIRVSRVHDEVVDTGVIINL